MKSRKVLTTSGCFFPLKCTAYQVRSRGKPSTSSMASRLAANSSRILCLERTEMPRSAITACLMASLLPSSIYGSKVKLCSASRRSNAKRVPEPASRARRRSCTKRSSGMFFSLVNGCWGWAMHTSGLVKNGCACTSY